MVLSNHSLNKPCPNMEAVTHIYTISPSWFIGIPRITHLITIYGVWCWNQLGFSHRVSRRMSPPQNESTCFDDAWSWWVILGNNWRNRWMRGFMVFMHVCLRLVPVALRRRSIWGASGDLWSAKLRNQIKYNHIALQEHIMYINRSKDIGIPVTKYARCSAIDLCVLKTRRTGHPHI